MISKAWSWDAPKLRDTTYNYPSPYICALKLQLPADWKRVLQIALKAFNWPHQKFWKIVVKLTPLEQTCIQSLPVAKNAKCNIHLLSQITWSQTSSSWALFLMTIYYRLPQFLLSEAGHFLWVSKMTSVTGHPTI